MSKTTKDRIRDREEKEREDVIDLLGKQVKVERKLVSLYEETEGDIKSSAVKHLLHMIQLDSKKHIDICQLVIKVLTGEDVLKEEKEELMKGLQKHIKLEKEALDRSKKILANVWIRQNKGLRELINTWRKDEREHHKVLKKLAGKTFFRISDFDFGAMLKLPEQLEERYVKYDKKIYSSRQS